MLDGRRAARSPTLKLPAGYVAVPHGPVEGDGQGRRRPSCSPSLLSFVFMYLILAAQFESWLHPVTILLSLPLTLPFALLSLHPVRPVARTSSRCSASWCCSAWSRRTRSCRSITPTSCARRAWTALEAILQANRDRLRPDPDDHAGLRGRHDPAGAVRRHRRRLQPGHRRRRGRRPDAVAAAHPAGDAGGLLAVRRRPPVAGAEDEEG